MEENSATVRRYSHRVLGRRRCWQEGVAHRSIIGSGGSQRPTYPRSFRHAIHSADQNGMAWRVPSICVATVPVAVVGSMGSMRAGAARRRPATVHANHRVVRPRFTCRRHLPAPLSPKSELLARLSDTFRRLGYDGASIADIATATGLGKSSLYHYFPAGRSRWRPTP